MCRPIDDECRGECCVVFGRLMHNLARVVVVGANLSAQFVGDEMIGGFVDVYHGLSPPYGLWVCKNMAPQFNLFIQFLTFVDFFRTKFVSLRCKSSVNESRCKDMFPFANGFIFDINVGKEYENFKESLQTTKDIDVYEIPQEYRDEIVRIVTFHEWKKYERI